MHPTTDMDTYIAALALVSLYLIIFLYFYNIKIPGHDDTYIMKPSAAVSITTIVIFWALPGILLYIVLRPDILPVDVKDIYTTGIYTFSIIGIPVTYTIFGYRVILSKHSISKRLWPLKVAFISREDVLAVKYSKLYKSIVIISESGKRINVPLLLDGYQTFYTRLMKYLDPVKYKPVRDKLEKIVRHLK